MYLKPITLSEDRTLKIYSSEDCQKLLEMYKIFYSKLGFNIPWIGYFIMKDERIVGSCGFKGTPKIGKVEIAYWTFREFEGQGVASFACRELITIAFKSNSRIIITAKTQPENNAATKVLQKNGFKFLGRIKGRNLDTVTAWKWALAGLN